MLDKSKGLVLSNEIVKPFTDPHWSLSNGITVDSDTLVFNNAIDGASAVYRAEPPFVPKRFYVVEFDFISYTSGAGVYVRIGSNYFTPVSTTLGRKKLVLQAGLTGDFIQLAEGIESGTYTLSNITVKELSGNHAYQTTSASRPILQRNATTGAYYLAFDGVDDFLQTNSINFTSTDKVSLVAGVRKLVDGNYGAYGAIAELSSSSDTNSSGFSFMSSAFQGFYFQTGAPTDRTFGTVYGSDSAPISTIVTAQYDRAKTDVSEIKARYNSGAYSSSGLTPDGATAIGNFGNHPIYIGRRGGTSLPFNGHIYGLIGIGRLTTDSETIALEKAIAKNTGVTLNV